MEMKIAVEQLAECPFNPVYVHIVQPWHRHPTLQIIDLSLRPDMLRHLVVAAHTNKTAVFDRNRLCPASFRINRVYSPIVIN